MSRQVWEKVEDKADETKIVEAEEKRRRKCREKGRKNLRSQQLRKKWRQQE